MTNNQQISIKEKHWLGKFGVPHKTLFGIKPYVARINGDLVAYLRPRTYDAYIANQIFNQNQYLPTERLGVKNVESVVDLGANIGLFALWAVAKYNPKKIICVEPDEGNLNLLQTNIDENKLDDLIEVVEAAVACKKGSQGLYTKPINRGGNYISPSIKENTVKTLTLKDIIRNKSVDYLKMDIEGEEKTVLPHIIDLKRQIKYINMELHGRSGITMGGAAVLGFALSGYDVVPHSQSVDGKVLGMIEAARIDRYNT